MKLGDNVKRIRISKGLTIKELSTKVSMAASTISDIENNKNNPTFTSLCKLAKGLDCSVDDLLLSEQQLIYENNADENSSNKPNTIFTNPQDAMKFILEQPVIMGFGGFDAKKLSDEDLLDFANDLLSQLKTLGKFYNKK